MGAENEALEAPPYSAEPVGGVRLPGGREERDRIAVELLDLMRRLVSAEVAIWCWHTFGRAPEVDGAARFHLAALHGRAG